MIHSSGKRRRYKRYLSVFIAFVMVCSVFIPAFAKSAGNGTDGDEATKASAAITYEFYSDGELYDSQTVKDGETLKEPSEPDKDGSTFEGWYTSRDGGSKFTDFSKQSVTESKTVKLYARWQEVEKPETESVEDNTDKGTSGNDTENSEEVSEEADSGKKEDASEETGSDIKEEDSKEQTESGQADDVSDETKNETEESEDEDSSKTEEVSDKEDISKQDETESSSDVSQSDDISEDSDKIKDEDTENVETEDDTIVDSADTSDDMEKNEGNTAVTQPQRELGNGISPLAITGPKTVEVGETITLQGKSGWNISQHFWSASLSEKVDLSNGNSGTVTVTGREAGEVTITHRYYQSSIFDRGWKTETYTIQVTEAPSSRSYDLYMYTLIPGVEEGSSDNADDVWNGMGIGSISNVAPPGSYEVMTDIDDGYGSSGAVINDKDQNNREYPPITVTENGRETTYYYAKTEAQKVQKGYYTIQWMRVRVSDGANDGNNNFNKPEVASGNNTYHLDGIVILNEENIYTVNFALKDVGGTRFIPDENFATRVKARYDASKLKRPDKNKVLDSQGNPIEGYPYPLTKTVNGITYTFDGWYLDETCTQKVNFDTYKINANTTFYARYIPETTEITVKKEVVGTSSADMTKDFSFTYKYTDNLGLEKTGTLSLSDGKSDSIVGIPVGEDLALTETNANGYTTSAKYDDETIQANETTGDTRTMTIKVKKGVNEIVVTNRKQIAETGQDENFIIVEKKFTGITEDQIPANFQITVTGQNGTSYTLTKDSSGWEEVDSADDSIIWRWKISGVGTGEYTVREENEAITDYTVTTTGIGDSVTVEAANVAIKEEEYETSCSTTNWPVGVEGNENFLFAAALTSKSSIVISAEPLSASVRAAVAQYIDSIFGGNWKDPILFYSVSEDGYEYSIDGKIFTYDPGAGEIIISKTSDWSHVASLSYDVTEASNPEIAITNAYKKNTSSIEVKKRVIGNLSDYDKKFAFIASWLGSDGTQRTEEFSLSHNDNGRTLNDLPVGTQVTISENRDGYDLESIKQGNTELSEDEINSDGTNSSCTVTVTNEPMTITFTNEKEAIVDVGIRMDNLPYILMLALVAGGAAAAVILRRRRS